MIDVLGIHAVRKAGADQRTFQTALRADADFLPLELRAVTARCGEEFLSHGIVDHGMFEAAFVLHGDRYRKRRKPVQEIGRAVERIDDPDEFTLTASAGFLAEDGVLRMAAADGGDDVRFGLAVDVSDEIVAALGVDLDRIETRETAYDQIAGTPGGAHSDIEQWLHRLD